MNSETLKSLIASGEIDRVEMTRSTKDVDKFREAICSFSNDMAGRGEPGYLLIGVDERDATFRLPITDELLQQFASYRSDGQILPLPVLNISKVPHPDGDGDVLVVQVTPHDMPPVRYRGRVHIRVGPRKDTASEAEERILMERRAANFPTFDATPCPEGELKRLDVETFRQTYRPHAVAEEVIAENHRTVKEQLAALRFFNLRRDCPTNAGMLMFAYDPLDLFPGAKIQFVQFDGEDLADEVVAEKTFTGSLITVLSEMDSFLKGRFTQKPVAISDLREQAVFDFPPDAIRELLMNAVLHRDYQSTSPVRFYQFADRIEIQNPGGLYGEASPQNFPGVNTYRNPIIAEAMHVLGYVNRFGRGVMRARRALEENGSSEPIFKFETHHFLSCIPKHPQR
ncbi:putative DNA binding domain-containing protein [Luteolibacter yonseiensis]|uniref:DNA binding domain-containing protein n=1 Tax=Luteolibacter yonseiensis TaxID=1144680 RepID=A0A934R0W8_9BACT|nr:ATP-binding protein [Luteolibacter yonseiensis]MBK1814123.1 putative DNA binding domain-containing protein [Luteolibacter yonseiensis]